MTDQLRGNREADQRLCFRYLDSTIPLLSKYKISSLLPISSSYTAWFVSDLVRNLHCWFSHVAAHIDYQSKVLNAIRPSIMSAVA